MATPTILAVVMAGGEGKRLYPLTAERSKPAVPFGGRYRIVDFVLSNLVNSGIYSIYLLVQYKSQSLIEHIRKAWVVSPISPRDFITVVPPQMRSGGDWFQGTADAVYQSLNLIYQYKPDLVAVFGADHVYRMDVRHMAQFHTETEADVTVAALPVPLAEAGAFGVIITDASARIRGFQEKPEKPEPMSERPGYCLASMGNYVFSADVLATALQEGHERGCTDFGSDILPMLVESHRVFAYDFTSNEVPGIKPYEEQSYWRDVGTIEAYYSAHRDLLGPEPRFDEFNVSWPIYSSKYLGPLARIISGEVRNCVIGAGSVINGAKVHNSVIGREVIVQEDVEIEDSIIMAYTVVGKGSRLRNAIVDRYNVFDPGTTIGYDLEADRRRFHVTDSGIVVVPVGQRGLEFVY